MGAGGLLAFTAVATGLPHATDNARAMPVKA